jgi:hypothetical protein
MMFSGDLSEEKWSNLEDNDVSWFKVMVVKIIITVEAIPNIIYSE